jgi:hypothetical protein
LTENRISSEDVDSTTALLNQGVRSIAIERAVSEMEGWRRKLEASGDPGLQPIAGNLAELERLLTADESDAAAIGRLLTELGDRIEAVVVSGTATPIADKLQHLSQLLTDQGRSATEEAQRSTTQGEAPGGRD